MKLHSLFFGTKRRAFAAVLVVLAALLVAVAAFPASAFASETAAGSSVTPPAATSTDPSTTAPQTAEATGPDAAAPQAAEATGADATAPQTAEATGSDTVAPQAAATTESGKMTPLATSTADITLSYQKDATGFVLAPQTVTVSAGLANQYFPGSTDGTTVTGLDAAVAAVIAIEGSNSQTAVTGAMGIVTDPTYGLYVSNYMGGYLMNFVNGASPDSIVDSLNNGDEVRLITPQDPMGSDSYSYFKYNGSKISSLSVNTGVSVNLAVMYTSLDWSTYPATATEQGSGGASVVVATSNGTGATFGSPVATADASGVAAVSFNKPGTYILSAVNKTSGAVPLASPWLTVNVGAPVGNPIGHVDDITASTTALGQIAIKGWALDGDAVTQTVRVDVYVGGPAGSAGAQGFSLQANQSRPDVNSVYPGVGDNHGFSNTITTSKRGNVPVYVYAINIGPGNNVLIGTKTIKLGAPGGNPIGCVDSITASTTALGQIAIKGWALDGDAVTQTVRVDVYVGGPAGSAGAQGFSLQANQSRPDVNSAYPGVGDNHGFSNTITTSKRGNVPVYVYAINIGPGNNVLIGTKTISVM